MQKTAEVYDVLISCPSDVLFLKSELENVITGFNKFNGQEKSVLLRPVSWEDAYPQFGSHPQHVINEQIVDKADICVAVFWTKFGTSTECFGSGTEEEIELLYSKGKHVFVYFIDKPINPSKLDREQYSRLLAFKERIKGRSFYCQIQDENMLVKKFREHLGLYVDARIRGRELYESKKRNLILWVDDRPENNVYVRSVLEEYGIIFDLALSTDRALALISKHNYALVISDMGRREGPKEGYVLLKKMRDMGNNIPFIIFSSNGSLCEHRAEAENNGAQGSTDILEEVCDMVITQLLG